jgi:hypothetical protein
MRRFEFCGIVCLGFLAALYCASELLAGSYLSDLQMIRSAHGFDRILIIKGEKVPGWTRPGERERRSESHEGQLDATQFLSSETLAWLEDRDFVASVSRWTSQVWDGTVAGHRLASLKVFGIGEEDVRTFRLGDPSLLSNGSIVLADAGAALIRGARMETIVLDLPENVLMQLPHAAAESIRHASRSVLPLSGMTLANPPGLRPGATVAYVHRDGDRLAGFATPASIYVVSLESADLLASAKAEIEAFLADFERPSSLGVQATVSTVDDYFPPLISESRIKASLLGFRVLLLSLFLLGGFGLAWLRLREHAFEVALRIAMGSSPRKAALSVHGRWLLRLASASLVGAAVAIVPALILGQQAMLAPAWLTVLTGLVAMSFGTAWIARQGLLLEPLGVLSGDGPG